MAAENDEVQEKIRFEERRERRRRRFPVAGSVIPRFPAPPRFPQAAATGPALRLRPGESTRLELHEAGSPARSPHDGHTKPGPDPANRPGAGGRAEMNYGCRDPRHKSHPRTPRRTGTEQTEAPAPGRLPFSRRTSNSTRRIPQRFRRTVTVILRVPRPGGSESNHRAPRVLDYCQHGHV